MSRQPPSMQENIFAPDRQRKVKEWMDGETVKEQLDQATAELGAVASLAWLLDGQYLEVEVDAAGSAIPHQMSRVPTAVLWYEPTTPGNWLRRTAGGDAVRWTRENVFLTSAATEVYRILLI